MRWALAFVGIVTACGAGASPASDAGGPDAAAVGALRLRWALVIDGLQGDCDEGWTVRVRAGNKEVPSLQARDAACEAAEMVIEGLAPGEWYVAAFLLDANGDVLGTSARYRFVDVVAGETVEPMPFVLATTREPAWGLEDIAGHTIEYYEANGALPASGEDTPFRGTCCATGGICWPMPTEWDEEPWTSIGFHYPVYHRFYYRFLAEKDAFVVRASHDSDCDNEYSIYELRATIDPTTGMIELGEITMTIEQNDYP